MHLALEEDQSDVFIFCKRKGKAWEISKYQITRISALIDFSAMNLNVTKHYKINRYIAR